MSRVKLSILVPTIPNRVGGKFLMLMTELQKQIGARTNIEILGLFDNKKRTLGEKRQAMIEITNGDYLVFIDDDDRLASTFINDVMDALEKNPDADCVVYDCICTINGTRSIHCKYGVEYEYSPDNRGPLWYGKPAHTMVYRSSIAKRHSFASKSFGEDTDWVKRACKDIKQQVRIDKVLYYYDCNTETSETRGPRSSNTLTQPTVNV
jgi:hypothetical protein